MNISTPLRLVVPAAESEQDAAAAKKSVQRSDRAPSPSQPRPDGIYRYGSCPATQEVSASLDASKGFPSMQALQARYPHVIARIRAAWVDPRAFDRLMHELLLQDRQDRKGFDPEAALELTRLQEYYATAVAKTGDSATPMRPGRPTR